MNRRRRTLPPVPPKAPSELRPLIAAMTEILETGEGVRGDPLDRKITLRDLLDSGIGKLRPGMAAGQDGNLDSGALPPAPDLSIPPAPEGFDAQGGFYGMVNLSWTIPGQQYRNHAYTNVYRNEEDNFANAEIVGREAGAFYTDYVRDDAIDPSDPTKLKGYYYWITFTSVADIEGPPNSPNGTYAAPLADLAYVIELITGQIDEGVLAKSLSQRIDLIDGIGEGSVASRLSTLQETLEKTDKALAQQIDDAQASLGKNVAAVQQTLKANVERIDDELLSLGALYTVQVQANGLVGGFGVYNDGTSVDAGFDVDRFWVGRTNAKKRKPFIIVGDETYIDTAMIRNGSIQEGQLGPISIGKMFLNDGTPVTTIGGLIRAEAIDVDNLSVAEAARFYDDVQSGNYIAGRQGWRIRQNGNVEFNQGQFNGQANFSSGNLGDKVMINNIDSLGLIRQRAYSGQQAWQRAENWTRPGSTLINGNQIFTGDAYVDTLQIKGHAIIVPASVNAAGATGTPTGWEWKTVAQVTLPYLDAGVYAIEAGFSFNHSYSYSSVNAGLVSVQARLIDNWGDVHVGEVLFDHGYGTDSIQQGSHRYAGGTFSIGRQLNNRFGGRVLQLQIQRTAGHQYGGHSVANRFITVLGAQR